MASSNLEEIEEVIDNAVADSVQTFLGFFKSERERLGRLFRSEDCSFCNNPDFSSLVKKLLETPLGTISLPRALPQTIANEGEETRSISPKLETTSTKEKAGTLRQDGIKEIAEDKCRLARRGRKRVARSAYEDMQHVATVEGKTKMNELLLKPVSIVSLMDENAFAVKHNDRLTVLSPSAKMKHTCIIRTRKVHHLPTWTQPALVQNPLNGQLVLADRGLLKVIEPIKLPKRGLLSVDANEIDLGPLVGGVPFGLAMSKRHQQCFTMIGGEFCAFSLVANSWALRGRWRMDMPVNLRNGIVATVRNDSKELFVTSDNGRVLYGVPVDENGALLPDNLRVVDDSFGFLKGAVTDRDGNIITADRNRCRLVVLTPDGEETLARITTNNLNRVKFTPSDVAVLTASENGELFCFSKDELYCSRVIASPDFSANRVIFFGCVEDCT